MRSKICLSVIFALVFTNALLAMGCATQFCIWFGPYVRCTPITDPPKRTGSKPDDDANVDTEENFNVKKEPPWALSPDKFDWNEHIAWHRDNCENTAKDEEKNMAHWRSWARNFSFDNRVVKPDPFCIKHQPADNDAGAESALDNDE